MLKVTNVMVVSIGGLGGSASTSRSSNNHHSQALWSSRHTVRMVSMVGSKTVTVSLVKRTLKSASQKGSIPTSELLKLGNM